MALAAGTRLGSYEIVAPIGAGGMGEVYRARDHKLDRDVAIKTLPEDVARDPERLARSEREAKLLASLNHPNIAAIYGLEEAGGVKALVMELVEGPTLADRIAQGAIPVDEAIPIAKQIADALEAAHEQGIIHRDLKPANVKVREDGTVKVLDFGLAKALEPIGAASPDASHSPTLTSPAMSQAGVIVGTAAYMSPEQARGKPVDRRADIWAFGVVFLEMVTGRKVFEGEDVSLILSSVLQRDPDWQALPKTVPPGLATFLRRCLTKDPRQRIHDIADVRLALEGAFEGVVTDAAAGVLGGSGQRPRAVAIAALTGALVVAGVGSILWPRPESRTVKRLTITPSADAPLRVDGRDRDLVITPDGTRVIYAADAPDGRVRILVRPLEAFEASALVEAVEATVLGGGAQGLAISPDGEWVSYVENNTDLKKVALTGGPPIPLVTIDGNSRGVTWTTPDTIVFASSPVATGLQSVSAAGGSVTVLTRADESRGEIDHLFPEALPDGRSVLFTIDKGDPGEGEIALLDLSTGQYEVLYRGGTHAHYLASGHLVFVVRGALLAAPFDLRDRRLRGTPVPVLSGVFTTPDGGADLSVSTDGTLVFVDDAAGGRTGLTSENQLVWVDREGRTSPAVEQSARYRAPRVSPDGERIAVVIAGADGSTDIWVIEPDRGGARTRLTFSPQGDTHPLWSPDGSRVVFSSSGTGGVRALHLIGADGSGAAEVLAETASNLYPESWSRDGQHLVLHQVTPEGRDLFSLQPGEEPTLFLATPFEEWQAAFSPDGRWLAYVSNESGGDEVYVRPYPGPGGRVPISNGGGRNPVWSSDGRELFFHNAGRMMSVSIEETSTLRPGIPRTLFEDDFTLARGNTERNYDVAPDGRFLMIRPVDADAEEPALPQIRVVLHWFEELKRLAPVE